MPRSHNIEIHVTSINACCLGYRRVMNIAGKLTGTNSCVDNFPHFLSIQGTRYDGTTRNRSRKAFVVRIIIDRFLCGTYL